MAGVAIAQVFRPFRRDQLASALNAVHPKGRAKIGFHRHGVTLPLAPKRWREELSVLWQPTHFDLIYVVGISLGVITQKTQHATRSCMGPRDSTRHQRANDLDGKSDDDVRAEMGDKFPKHIYHSIACIGALIAHQDADSHRLVSSSLFMLHSSYLYRAER
jgi:hypothetical protein